MSIPEIAFDDSLPHMDREQIDMLLMVDDDEDPTSLLRELFGLFEMEGKEKMESLHQVCVDNDQTALRKIVHFVAGSAGNLGLSRLCLFYRAIEHAVDEGRFSTIAHCEMPVLKSFEKACDSFRKEFEI
ncbi:Hpt domain-containing protein [Coraliomargarita parva]|uniref:Hpt domain-containing protein n=1 Tax=Coraliomargarita parva TaxID=3014050 RepID=UPI0022B50A3C|nr:Hpt domain-containing protein [Coraliomargarita parva]